MNLRTSLAPSPGGSGRHPQYQPRPRASSHRAPVPGLGLTPGTSSRIVALTITTGPIITVKPHVGKLRPGWGVAAKPGRGHIQAQGLPAEARTSGA